MKKVLKRSLLAVALMLSILVTSGQSSIVASAADTFRPATNLAFTSAYEFPSFSLKTGSAGYYRVLIECTGSSVKNKVLGITSSIQYTADTNFAFTSTDITYYYDYIGKYTMYAIGSPNKIPQSYKKIDDFKKDSSCTIVSESVDIKSRVPAPKNVQAKLVTKNNKKYYRVTWDKDGYSHGIAGTLYSNSVFNSEVTSVDIPAAEGTNKISVKTITDSHELRANSLPFSITLENGTEKEAPVTVEKKIVETKLPEVITVNGITYKLGADNTATVTAITGVKNATIDQITLDGVTYRVTSIAPSACEGNRKIKNLSIASSVEKIDSKAFFNCKKLKEIKIKANKELTIGDSAFKKINKKATIKISGVKGKAKKKLLKEIKK